MDSLTWVGNGFLIFTPGATPADLLLASMTAEPFIYVEHVELMLLELDRGIISQDLIAQRIRHRTPTNMARDRKTCVLTHF